MRRALELALLLALPLAAVASPDADAVYQYSTTRALLVGLYDGELSLADAARSGDLAIGTVNGIDGELVGMDGRFFRVASDGRAYALPPDTRTPFIVMKHFRADWSGALPPGLDLAGLMQHLDAVLPSLNHFHAIRIRGRFGAMLTRSEPRQTPPYRALAEVMAEQQVRFELGEVAGTLVGFRSPSFVEGLNVPGYHFHFLSEDETRGGHVLSLRSLEGRIAIDHARQLALELPRSKAFAESELGVERSAELDAVERGR